jgi:hypothetical protein
MREPQSRDGETPKKSHHRSEDADLTAGCNALLKSVFDCAPPTVRIDAAPAGAVFV